MNCSFSVADSRSVPLQDGKMDIAIEGWTLALMADWNGDSWKDVLVDVVNEMNRVVKTWGKDSLGRNPRNDGGDSQPTIRAHSHL